MPDPSNSIDDNDEFDFSDFIKEFGHGITNKRLTTLLREVNKACQATGQKGSVTLKIEMGAKGGIAEVRTKVDAKRPEPGLPGGHYFVTETGAFVEEDPRQLKLAPKVIGMPGVRNIGGNGNNGGNAS